MAYRNSFSNNRIIQQLLMLIPLLSMRVQELAANSINVRFLFFPFSLFPWKWRESFGPTGGGDDDLAVTSSLVVMERLAEGDQVYVRILIETGNSRDSGLLATNNKATHFTGHKIAE